MYTLLWHRVGISMAENKVPGIRAAVVGEGLALMIVHAWLNAEFIGGKHQIRLDLIKEIEEKYSK